VVLRLGSQLTEAENLTGKQLLTKMLETRLECDHHPCAPVSSAFGASASKTSSPSCGLLDLVQAARALHEVT